eukprot:gene21611-27650_t
MFIFSLIRISFSLGDGLAVTVFQAVMIGSRVDVVVNILLGHNFARAVVWNREINAWAPLTFLIVVKTGDSDYEGSGHVHMSFSDEKGVTTGGHVLSGNIIYTTAEITLLELKHARYDRVLDDKEGGSGYYELQVFKDEH